MSQAVLEAPGTGSPDGDDAVKDGLDGITELEKIDVDRVDGVGNPANGIPTLMLKGIREDGETAKAEDAAPDGDEEDDGPDGPGDEDAAVKAVADATPEQREAYLTAAAEWRAREPVHKGAAGDGTSYLQVRAAWQKWNTEGTDLGLDGTGDGARKWLAGNAVSDDVIKAATEAEEAALGDLAKRKYSAGQRRQLASEGKALPDGSYPIDSTEDLHNAAALARSGHGNVAAARRHIARSAKRLGKPNPLDGHAAASKTTPPPAKGKVDCPTCDTTRKIKGGHVTCPDCKGKGKAKPGKAKAAKAVAEVTASIEKAVDDGLLTREAADALLAQVEEARKATRPLPADARPADRHREPDGTSTVEQLEPEAGMATDKDPVPDKVPASVAAMGKEASYGAQRMHDALCAAYPASDVLKAYPALTGIADAIDPAWFTAASQPALAEAAQILKDADPAIVEDGRAFLAKAFTDLYPSAHCSPADPPKPGSYQRPYLTAGHAAEHASGKADVPPAAHVPDPGQFHRGYLTAGHAAQSPADRGGTAPTVASGSSRSNYASAAKTYAEQSMKALHDHIAATFDGTVCPMAANPSVLPPDMGARNIPTPQAPLLPGGYLGKGDTMEDPDGKQARKERKRLAADVAKALAENGTVADAAGIKTLVDAQLAPLKEAHETRLAELQKQLDELGAQPDPAMAPVRGQMARPTAGTAAPVEKRSLVDESRDREVAALAKQAADRADYIEYLQKQVNESTSPQTREAAQAILDDEVASRAPVPARAAHT